MPAKKNPDKWAQITCPHCNKLFLIRRCYLERQQSHACSQSCAYYLRLANPSDILGSQRRVGKNKHKKPWSIVSGYKRFNRGKYAGKYIHRLIVERILGRELKQDEVVHHIDGNKLNIKRSNLLVCSRHYHKELHDKMSYLYQREHFGV